MLHSKTFDKEYTLYTSYFIDIMIIFLVLHTNYPISQLIIKNAESKTGFHVDKSWPLAFSIVQFGRKVLPFHDKTDE